MNTNGDSQIGFAQQIREATREVHTRAEQTTFIRGFLRGTASLDSYIQLLVSLHPVYAAMEEGIDALCEREPLLAPFNLPALHRTQSLARDLDYLSGPDWRTRLKPLDNAVFYARRIRLVAADEPVRLIGHFYTRYLGDLSGGQILARIAERSLGLAPGAGSDFYQFDSISDIPAMKTAFRNQLDTFGCSVGRASREAVVAEAIHAFRCNIAVFEQLKGNALRSFLRSLPLPWVRAPRLAPQRWNTAHAH